MTRSTNPLIIIIIIIGKKDDQPKRDQEHDNTDMARNTLSD